MKKQKVTIPTIIGVLFLMSSLPIAVLMVNQRQNIKSGAQQINPPQEVKVTNVTDSSFTVTWLTKSPSTGFVVWGENENNLNKTDLSETEDNSYIHSVTITGLLPNKLYYFKINSGGNLYSDSQKAWVVKTAPIKNSTSPSSNLKIGGKVITASGKEAANTLVFLEIEGATPLSTITSQNGNWIISLDIIVDKNSNNYLQITPDMLAKITAQAGPQGNSWAKVYLNESKTLPPMILGENHDFTSITNTEITQESSLPLSEISSPPQIPKKPKFSTEDVSSTTNSSKTEITIESLEENETIYTTTPEFFGKAPPQTEITIKVESENPMSATISVSKNGEWKWSPPKPLTPGKHKITITYRDENGVLRSIVKNFIVQAAEVNEPAFESTPSATIKTEPSPSLSPTPTTKNTPTTTVTTTPRPTLATTQTTQLPDSGVKTPTILLFGIGLLLFIASGIMLFAN